MESIIGRAGHAVHLAQTIEDARQTLEAREVDLLLLDLTGGPGADYEAARLCRRTRPSLTIIALSGDLPEEAEARAQEIGLDAILPKPVEPSRLIAAINAALQGDAGSPEVVARLAPQAVVTELASHPRFAAEAANSAADDRAIAALRSTGRGSGEFLQSVIDAFRADSRLIVADIAKAARADDLRAFDEGIEALHDRAANFGEGRLRDLLRSMRQLTPALLRRQGADYVQRIELELAKLDAVLMGYLKTGK
jgi:DNA-binding NarL/FixJ family response regulator